MRDDIVSIMINNQEIRHLVDTFSSLEAVFEISYDSEGSLKKASELGQRYSIK